jgi:hypothetical protein
LDELFARIERRRGGGRIGLREAAEAVHEGRAERDRR